MECVEYLVLHLLVMEILGDGPLSPYIMHKFFFQIQANVSVPLTSGLGGLSVPPERIYNDEKPTKK